MNAYVLPSRGSWRRLRWLTRIFAAALLSGCAACATSASRSTGPGGANVLTRAELLETNMPSLYEAVQQTRPGWLHARGSPRIGQPAEVLVFVDEAPVGGVDVLRSWRSQDVLELRFLTASDAATRFGTTAELGGVIEVRTR